MSELFTLNSFNEYNKYLIQRRKENNQIAEICEELEINGNLGKIIDEISISPRELIEIIAIRRKGSYYEDSGGGNIAAENETDRLYAKNPWKFVEEFLQNADDCNYQSTPQINIIIDEIHSTVEFSYNEIGFTKRDILSITAFSQSTKIDDVVQNQTEEGIFYKEKTGRKGKGFKSVFSLSAENIIVHIRSNGFSFKLDNNIGRIMPVWENDPDRMDDNTHIIVEMVNPAFEMNSIYEELKCLFCMDKCENIFANSPFLFMHRMKLVHITRINSSGVDEFKTEYKENYEQTEYKKPIQIDTNKTLLAGIRKNDVFYQEQYQTGHIISTSQDLTIEIPVVRYTRMIEDEKTYRNYSVIAPILKKDTSINWKTGSLFRTFPMSAHIFNMPISIDAPFELNPDRCGIQYRDENKELTNSSEWNNSVAKNLFEPNGVYESFMYWIRSIDNIMMDKYISSERIVLFQDISNNSDGHGNYWVKLIDVSEISKKLQLFRLFAKDDFVSLDDAEIVNKDLFNWQNANDLFSLIMGEEYKSKVLSDIYIGSSLFRAKPIVRVGFTNSMNQYLDIVEKELGIASEKMINFINTKLYPYLMSNKTLINNTEKDAFKKLRIYFSTVYNGKNEMIVRESFDSSTIWLYDKKDKHLSINQYRIVESSPVNMSLIGKIVEENLDVKNLDDYFAYNNLNKVAQKCTKWNDIRDLIESVLYFGADSSKLSFKGLERYVLSKNIDSDNNAFRDSGVVEEIPDDDILLLSEYVNDIDLMAIKLKAMGLKKVNEYFNVIKNHLELRDDTIKLLKSDISLDSVLQDIKAVKEQYNKYIDSSYEEFRKCKIEAIQYFLNSANKLFSNDTYRLICEDVQEDEKLWNNNNIIASQILIQACSNAETPISNKNRQITISIEDVLKYNLEECVENIIKNSKIHSVKVENNGLFEIIPNEEIKNLLTILLGESKKLNDYTKNSLIYYKCNFKKYNSKRLYVKDGRNGHIYLSCDNTGDYKKALEKCVNESFDTEKIKIIEEIKSKFAQENENIIIPKYNKYKDLDQTYNNIKMNFDSYTKQQIINIISWYRYTGFSKSLGNGNVNSEREIEDDYKNEPWKFVYEFIQNVDDCNYSDKKPELNIVLNKEKNNIEFQYNENGFTVDDIDAITTFGNSNKIDQLEEISIKDGIFDREKTGRKGRGFKSVFALPGESIVVHIVSNGFSLKFVKRIGSIIPIWEDVENSNVSGTKIIIEGFEENYLDMLYNKMKENFGVNEISSFCSRCPILYLRKLHKVKVQNDSEFFSISITPTNQVFSTENYETKDKEIVAGIINNGEYKKSLWEDMDVTINTEKAQTNFTAVRYSRMFKMKRENIQLCKTKVASIFAPIFNGTETIQFKRGSLYRTLPLNENKLSIPLAINAPFDVNSGRSAIENTKINTKIINYLGETFISNFYTSLRNVDNIHIEKYIPSTNDKIGDVDIKNKIKSLEILPTYTGNEFVSCTQAKVLLDECYSWVKPEILYSNFNIGTERLIAQRYSNLNVVKSIDFKNDKFVDNLNNYLDEIQLDSIKYTELFKKHIYPYLERNYEYISKLYKSNDKGKDLQQLKIFTFEMSNGDKIRENADEKKVWMTDVPNQYKSFSKYRNIGVSSLCDYYSKNEWVKNLHKETKFKEVFNSDKLSVHNIKNWCGVEELVQTILYYNIYNEIKIPYLSKCVLSEEFDKSENLFRKGFEITQNPKIINKIITKDDITKISLDIGMTSNEDVSKIVQKIKEMGLKDRSDFFEPIGTGSHFELNESTISLLESYCNDKNTAQEVLQAIEAAMRSINQKSQPKRNLDLTYNQIKNCNNIVFANIFENGIINGDIESNLANDFCSQRKDNNTIEYIEAFLRALTKSDKIVDEKEINISLSQILKRGLGQCVQDCKIKNFDKLKLDINIDIAVEDYPSKEIDKAIQWLDSESSSKIECEYYVADKTSFRRRK